MGKSTLHGTPAYEQIRWLEDRVALLERNLDAAEAANNDLSYKLDQADAELVNLRAENEALIELLETLKKALGAWLSSARNGNIPSKQCVDATYAALRGEGE